MGLRGAGKNIVFTYRMKEKKEEVYEPPAVEVLAVAVERGFEGSATESSLPKWGSEDGYWQ